MVRFSANNRYQNIIILLIAIIICNNGAYAINKYISTQETSQIISELEHQLTTTHSAADSLKVMFNIFDLSTDAESTAIANEILNITKRNNNYDLGLDIICQIAYKNLRNDSVLIQLEKELDAFPESPLKRMTTTYISLRRAGHTVLYSSAKERITDLKTLIGDNTLDDNSDIYDKISVLGTVCLLSGTTTTHREMSVNNINDLIILVEQLPKTDIYLKKLVYNYASLMYANIGMIDKSVATSRKRLETFDRITQKFHNEGRIYYNCDFQYYQVYRLMIECHEALTPNEIEDIYSKAIDLVNSDPKISLDYNNGKCALEAFYLFSHKDYQKALPILEYLYFNTTNTRINNKALRDYIVAAEAIGEREKAYDAAKLYINQLTDYIDSDSKKAYLELQVLYDINKLQAENVSLLLEQAQQEIYNHRLLISIIVIACIILLIALLICIRLYLNKKALIKDLKNSYKALKDEGEVLRNAQKNLTKAHEKVKKAERHKSEFIDNVTHEMITPAEMMVEYTQLLVDCVDSSNKKYLQRYADIVKLNAELFVTMLNDVFSIRRIDEGNLSVSLRPITVHELCKLAVDVAQQRLNPAVELIYNERTDSNTLITTDGKRVEQVLINLLLNAAKFTEIGTIELEYKLNLSKNTITFTVTDTGVGIAEGMEESIFDRFIKLDKQSQGLGLGLPICRIIANLLNGNIYVDKTYRKGARFVFEIPMS